MENNNSNTQENVIQIQVSDIQSKLESILIWIEGSYKGVNTEESEVENEVSEIDDNLSQKQILDKLVNIQTQIIELSKAVGDFAYKDEINGRLHDELQKYKGGLRKEFTSPLLKGIIREYDRNIRMMHFYNSKQELHENESARNLLKQFEITADGLLELLNDNDIEIIDVNSGAIFSPKEHRLIEVIEVEDPTKDNSIESVISCGFIDNSTGRVFRNPEVRVYKIKN
jgi:molecular chaperone GrpE (heat shock protein)